MKLLKTANFQCTRYAFHSRRGQGVFLQIWRFEKHHSQPAEFGCDDCCEALTCCICRQVLGPCVTQCWIGQSSPSLHHHGAQGARQSWQHIKVHSIASGDHIVIIHSRPPIKSPRGLRPRPQRTVRSRSRHLAMAWRRHRMPPPRHRSHFVHAPVRQRNEFRLRIHRKRNVPFAYETLRQRPCVNETGLPWRRRTLRLRNTSQTNIFALTKTCVAEPPSRQRNMHAPHASHTRIPGVAISVGDTCENEMASMTKHPGTKIRCRKPVRKICGPTAGGCDGD